MAYHKVSLGRKMNKSGCYEDAAELGGKISTKQVASEIVAADGTFNVPGSKIIAATCLPYVQGPQAFRLNRIQSHEQTTLSMHTDGTWVSAQARKRGH